MPRKRGRLTQLAHARSKKCKFSGPRPPLPSPGGLDGRFWTSVSESSSKLSLKRCLSCDAPVNHSPSTSPVKRLAPVGEDPEFQQLESNWRAVSKVLVARAIAKVKKTKVTVREMKRIAHHCHMSYQSQYRIVHKATSGKSLVKKVPVRGSKYRRPSVRNWLVAKCKEWKGVFTVRRLVREFRAYWGFGCVGSIHSTMMRMGWSIRHRCYLPL